MDLSSTRNGGIRYNLRTHQIAFNKTIQEDKHGFLTEFALRANTIIGTLLTPISFLNPATTIVFGFMGNITFKVALTPLFLVAVVLGLFLFGTSWLWVKAPVLRIFLVLPGILIAAMATRYVGLLPFYGKVDIRLASTNICMIWPLSYPLMRRTAEVAGADW